MPVGIYGKRACREATEWRLIPKVIKGGESAEGNVDVCVAERFETT